jgi:uncharacterized BrkB/YihY/UPF0761 family membrane protein
VFFVAIGVAALVIARDYKLGSLLRMGPGYFPRAIAIGLIVLGAAVVFTGLRRTGEASSPWFFRPVVLVLGALAVFGWGVERLGLIVSIAFLIAIASWAQPGRRWWEWLVLTAVLSAIAWLVFVQALQLPFNVWPTLVSA